MIAVLKSLSDRNSKQRISYKGLFGILRMMDCHYHGYTKIKA